ncbi:MAG: DPP IV N-terminal domain-containing protein [Candidatus Cloacimonetes bacterium]|nr:DPP IV N-terminal domain-containing protein [Candidatus Cloacimonadota bacterium]
MKIFFLILFFIQILFVFAFEPHFMSDPEISPDGTQVCFVYLSDLWLVPFEGGTAIRLTSTEGDESNPTFSPDGSYIAFNSNRDGWSSIYKIPSQGGLAEIISREPFSLKDWFPNDKSLLVSGNDPSGELIYYKMFQDGTFQEIISFAGYYSAVDKSGNMIIFSRNGHPYREKYQGSTNGDLWQYNIKKKEFTRLTETDYTERYPVFSKSGKVYFAASDGEVFQLYAVENMDFKKRRKLTKFKKWSVRDISISSKDDKLVFEKFDSIWKYDSVNNKAEKLIIEIKEDILDSFDVKKEYKNKFKNYAVSPNGKLVVFTYKFDLFAVPEKGGDVKQLTFSQSGIQDILIMDDNKTIYFTSFVKGKLKIFKLNILNPKNITKMTWSEDKNILLLKKDQNHLIIYYSLEKNRGKLAIADMDGQNIKEITDDDEYVYSQARISPDKKYLLYVKIRPGIWSRHLILYNLETNNKHLIKNYDGGFYNVFWGKDGKSAFITQNSNLYRIDLTARKDFFLEEDNWEDILNPSLEKEKKKKKKDDIDDDDDDEKPIKDVEIDLDNISERFIKITDKNGWNSVVQIKNDSILYYINSFEDKKKLYKIDYNGKNEKLIYSFSGDIEQLKYNKKNKSFYFIERSKLKKIGVDSKKVKTIKNDFKYEYNSLKLNYNIFEQAWAEFENCFYDPEMHNVDWKEAFNHYKEYVKYAYDTDILADIISEMIGEVNASHTGFYPRRDKRRKNYSIAYAGFLPDFSESQVEGIKIKKVYRNSKLMKPFGISDGDILLKVDDEKIPDNHNFTKMFVDKVGEKIKLEFQTPDSIKSVMVKGLNYREIYMLHYQNWVEERTEMVEDWSGADIGYAHIRSMNTRSYDKFWQDVYADNYDKKALIIDVRNNGGGNIHDELIDLLTKKSYALSSSRYFDAQKLKSPTNTWEKPMVLLINENSYSDAEIFPHLFKYFKLGKVIGMPTSGAVIGTGHHNFMDGSSMRTPANGWFTKEEINMEGNGVQPDIIVEPTPQQIIDDDDVQLKRAVAELQKMF